MGIHIFSYDFDGEKNQDILTYYTIHLKFERHFQLLKRWKPKVILIHPKLYLDLIWRELFERPKLSRRLVIVLQCLNKVLRNNSKQYLLRCYLNLKMFHLKKKLKLNLNLLKFLNLKRFNQKKKLQLNLDIIKSLNLLILIIF